MADTEQSGANFEPHRVDDVEQLLRNAQLRYELEPFYDESITSVNLQALPTAAENDYLASMLQWERAPSVPIAAWFTPPLELPSAAQLDDHQLHALLWQTIGRLYEKRVVLDFTDHLCDRDLYRMIQRDILPAHEKLLDRADRYVHFNCAIAGDDPDVWLRYYASDEERQGYGEGGHYLPPKAVPPYPRETPREP